MNLIIKILISAVLIGAISELARRHSGIAALLAALPLVSVVSMIWIYQETKDIDRISNFSLSVFWYVVPSLILFALLPWLLRGLHLPFYAALLMASLATVVGFFILKAVLGRFGIAL